MARLFDIVKNEIVLSPYALAVPVFKKIWDRDKSKTKDKAYKELTYVVFICDFYSPYRDIPEFERYLTVTVDVFKDKEWEPDSLVEEAIDKYKKLQETPNMRLLKATKSTLEKMAEYFENIDFKF